MTRSIARNLLSLLALNSIVGAGYLFLLSGCAEKIDSPQEFIEVAYRHERDGEFPEAVAAYRKSLDLNPNQPTTWYDMGVSYAAMDKMPEAVEAYSKSIELDQTSARPYNNRATAYARLKQYDKAIADCDQAIAIDPNDFLAWRNRGLAKHDKGDLDSAIADYDESIRINGRVAETYHYRGNVFLDQKKYSRSLEDFEQAVLLDERMAAAHLSKAIALARVGRESDATAARAKAQELGSKVDDVIIANLLPAAPVADSNLDFHVAAVSFVRGELAKSGMEIDSGVEPFDLQSGDEANRTRYVIRTVLASDKDAAVEFTASELRQIETQESSTTLLIVQVTAAETKEVEAPGPPILGILKTIEKWTPDVARMQPVAWELPISESGDPVASANGDGQ